VFLGIQLLVVGLQVSEPWKGVSLLYWFLLLGPILFITILIHELGHALAARSVGGHADGILMWPLGGLALLGHHSGPKGDLWVSAAGPLTHLPMTGIWLVGLWAARVAKFGPGTPLTLVGTYPMTYEFLACNVCNGSVILNITIFLFNLIPAYPLDGGRIFVDALLLCRVPAKRAAIAAVVVSSVLCAGLIVYGAIPPVNAMLILVAAFVFLSALQLAQSVRMGTLSQHPLFAYTFKEGERPADLAGAGGNGNGAGVGGYGAYGGAQLPVVGQPVGGPTAGNPFAAQPGAAAAVQQAAVGGPPPGAYAQHASYAPAVPPQR